MLFIAICVHIHQILRLSIEHHPSSCLHTDSQEVTGRMEASRLTRILHGLDPARAVFLHVPEDDLLVVGARQEQGLVGVAGQAPQLVCVCLV